MITAIELMRVRRWVVSFRCLETTVDLCFSGTLAKGGRELAIGVCGKRRKRVCRTLNGERRVLGRGVMSGRVRGVLIGRIGRLESRHLESSTLGYQSSNEREACDKGNA